MIYSTYTYYIYIFRWPVVFHSHFLLVWLSHAIAALWKEISHLLGLRRDILWGWASWYPVNSHQTHQTTISWICYICYTPKWAPATLTSSAPPFSARSPKPSTPPSAPSPGVAWPLGEAVSGWWLRHPSPKGWRRTCDDPPICWVKNPV